MPPLYKDILSPLIGEDLLSALLAAVDDEALQRETVVTTARIALADALSDDKDLIKDMLENSTADTARDLAQTLLLNQGFEDLTKKSILARIIKVFPSVQTLVATKSSDSKEKRLLVSSWSLQARREELEDIVKNQLPASKLAIEAARGARRLARKLGIQNGTRARRSSFRTPRPTRTRHRRRGSIRLQFDSHRQSRHRLNRQPCHKQGRRAYLHHSRRVGQRHCKEYILLPDSLGASAA